MDVAVGASREDVIRLIGDAGSFHIEGMKERGLPVPPPTSEPHIVDVITQ